MDQDIPEKTFQEVADIAKKAVQKVDEAQNVEKNFKSKLMLLRMKVSKLKQYLKY